MTPHDWSPQQVAALDDARRWLDAPRHSVPQVHRIFGYAGTGKTTLARELAEHAGYGCLAAAYTGKAASVMAKKGLPQAQTIHRLIYTPTGPDTSKLDALTEELETLEAITDPDMGTLKRINAVRRAVEEAAEAAKQPAFTLKEYSDLSCAPLLILDECSMVDARMGEDLLSFGARVLVLGDPAQLPPIRGAGFFTDCEPDSLLTEIHRQAQDSPIIRLATVAREGRALPRGDFSEARVLDQIGATDALTHEQVLCGTNNRRRAINARHRHLAGHLDFPMPRAGERLVCLKNNYDYGMMNGTLWITTNDAEWEAGEPGVTLDLYAEGDPERAVAVWAEACVLQDEADMPQWSSYAQMTWGYALTVHKAQGSGWDSVLLFDDWPGRNEMHRQFLYTGITRAAQRLTVVL